MSDDERLARIEALLAGFEAEISRLKAMEFSLLRLEELIEKIALGLGIVPHD